MLLRSTVSSTKKFFQKTLKNFKSFFSPGYYERLPKTSPHNNHFSYSVAANSVKNMDKNNNTSYQELEKFYTNDQWDSEKEKEANRRNKNKAALISSPTKQESDEVYNGSSFIGFPNAQKKKKKKKNQVEKREECDNKIKKRSLAQQRVNSMREHGTNCIVEQKLRELEMLDMSNVDHVLDIEEVLHYYSRLTCPAYLEIVDRFFMQVCAEFFGPAWYPTPCRVNSRMKLGYQ